MTNLEIRRMAYYVPIDEAISGNRSLVDHASRKLLYHELSHVFELAISRQTVKEVGFLRSVIRPEDSPIVDLGCGVGRHCGNLQAQFGYQVIGIDASEHAIQNARQRWPQSRFEVQDFRRVDLQGVAAGAAICMWSTFNYLSRNEDVESFSKSVTEILRPGGILVLDLPNHRTMDCGPYVREDENDRYTVKLTVEKRLVGNIAEGLYQYHVLDKATGISLIATDQELNRVYLADEVLELLGPDRFSLSAIFGDYDLQSKFDAAVSPRQILLLRKS